MPDLQTSPPLTPLDPPVAAPPNPWPALVFCMTLPSLMTWAETRWVLPTPSGERSAWDEYVFLFGKVLQFSFPLVYVLCTEPRRLRLARPSRQGLLTGAIFAGVAAAGAIVLYFVFLRGTALLGDTPHKIRAWLDKFHLNSMGGFILFGALISIPHSLLEEYYWRWFVFGWMRRQMPWIPAATIASLGFMAHHVVVLSYYLPGYFWLGVVPFSLCVAVGGFAWCWLYHRTGNLYAAWLSHFLVDAAIMVVGWDMVNS
jgi:membrane protease YdiL (CAAX protease family)